MPARANRTTAEGPATRSPRDRLLDAASELFYAEGVQSVGINRVIEHAGVSKDSLYRTFGSKEGLVAAYLNKRHEQTLARLRSAATGTTDPVDRLLAVFDAQAKMFRARDFRGCAFAAATAEGPRDGQIDAAAESYRQDIHKLFTELADAAGAADPAVLASQLQLIYDGGGLAAKMDRNPGIAAPARAAAAAVIAAALGGNTTAGATSSGLAPATPAI